MSNTTLTELEQELAQREESAHTILSLVAPALEELRKATEALEAAAAQYVTRTEVQTTLVDGITDVVNRRFDELDKAGEERHALLVEQTEARFALTATKEELSGVQLAGAENSASITAIKASQETWQAAMEARVVRLESGQRKQAANIEKISQNTTGIKDAVEAMQHTFTETLERDTKRQAEVDRELALVKEAQTKTAEAQVKDSKAISDLESAVRGAVDLAENVDSLAARNYQALNFAITGNKETKTPGLVDQMATLNNAQRLLNEKQDTLYRGLNWLTFLGTRRGFLVIGVSYVAFLILTSFLLGRPDIVAGFLPKP